jgi:CheY-like chemotaxis protein
VTIIQELRIRSLLEKVLTGTGYSTDAIGNSAIAMHNTEASEIYNGTLLDIRLPGMSKTELYSQIMKKKSVMKGKIIIVTGDVMGSDIKEY